MGRRAYYKCEYNNHTRDITVMAAELSRFNIPYKLTINSLRVGDRTLMRYNYGTESYGRILPEDPIFNIYNHALSWLIADKPGLDVSEHGEIVIKHSGFSPVPRKIDFTWGCEASRFFGRIIPAIKRIEINTKKGVVYTTVIWADGSKPTVVKKSEDDPHDLYFAVASAIAIKVYGSNSAFKREIEEKF